MLHATLGEKSVAWFDVIAAGDMVPMKKPAADIYLYALKQLGEPAAGFTVLSGDAKGANFVDIAMLRQFF